MDGSRMNMGLKTLEIDAFVLFFATVDGAIWNE
jgi:hypothetical protein